MTQTVTVGTSAPPVAATTTVATTVPPLGAEGKEVRDGNLAFTVTRATEDDSNPAGPAEVFVEISLRNVGNQAAEFNGGYQRLIDIQGREFSVDKVLRFDNGETSSAAVLDLNPGLNANLILRFEVPRNLEPAGVVLRESASSPGVAVAITLAFKAS
ncbi:DUF4352 domain-containing protein [Mycobacterium sp. 94-17]|uniref:DUF4352 domain-containing protein n=1 Tax=Mycobacterium sp. 94-17 TaxID=2986147 RepID=UPI002D1EE924|nr:DUF4352 domain-containing protein [Mycobacterium sp. 94-17]MEB4208736.1 DUF4352 domain-containing protein [Mycobacterium sp. 94-17]